MARLLPSDIQIANRRWCELATKLQRCLLLRSEWEVLTGARENHIMIILFIQSGGPGQHRVSVISANTFHSYMLTRFRGARKRGIAGLKSHKIKLYCQE